MYVAKKDVVTEFGTYKKGDEVSDVIGSRYSAFEEVKPEVKKPKKQRKPKEEPKEEILVEDGDAEVVVEITEEG